MARVRPSATVIGYDPAGHAISGLVLLVDDEPFVRGFVLRALELAGLSVLPVESAEEAIRLSQSTEDAIDILVTDLRLPEMSGLELIERVRCQRPGLPVVLMSGMEREDAILEANADLSGMEFLHKPFRPSQLLDAIRHLLLGSAEAAEIPLS